VYALDLEWERNPQTGRLPGIREQAQQTEELITSRHLKDVVLVGASNGGVPVMQVVAGALILCALRVPVHALPVLF